MRDVNHGSIIMSIYYFMFCSASQAFLLDFYRFRAYYPEVALIHHSYGLFGPLN